MITYLYWIAVIGLAMAFLMVLGKYNHWRTALIGTLVILLTGWGAYYFHFEQMFVKRFGGVMTISVPKGQQHIAATWKDDHLWIENYDPQTNTCHFTEYSRGNLLEGRVNIENCNPVKVAGAVKAASRPQATAPEPAATTEEENSVLSVLH